MVHVRKYSTVHHRVLVLVLTPCKEVHVPAVIWSALHTLSSSRTFFLVLQSKLSFYNLESYVSTQFLQHNEAGASPNRNHLLIHIHSKHTCTGISQSVTKHLLLLHHPSLQYHHLCLKSIRRRYFMLTCATSYTMNLKEC